MNNKKIFITGGTGLIGSRISELLHQKYEFTNISTSMGVDITKPESLTSIVDDTEHDSILHLAGKTDVDGCERDKELGENGDAYKVNVLGTENIVNAAKKTNKKIIYISTDFVFDGEKLADESYSETDVPHPVNWYANTKYQGEEIVKNSELPYLIVRVAYPYRKAFEPKKDFVRAILGRLQNNLPIAAITDHIFCPTFIDDIATAIDILMQHESTGIYHVVGSQALTPYDAAIHIAQTFDCDVSLIGKTTRAEYFKDKAIRPFNLSLNNDRIQELGVTMKGFEEGLQQLKV